MNRKRWISIQKKVLFFVMLAIIGGVFVTLDILGSRIYTRSIPVGSVKVHTKYSKYLVGETVTFTVTNDYNSTVYINNNCPSEPLEVYKYSNSKWVRIHDKTDVKECKEKDRFIAVAPNNSLNGSFARWPNLFKTAGRYRIVAFVDYYNELPYSDFEIIEKPKVPTIPKTTISSSPTSSSAGSTNQTNNQSSATPTSTPTTQTVSISAGTVTVSVSGSYITVLSVTPKNGFTSYEGGGSGTQVEITFKGNGETQLQLMVVNGQLVSKTENGD